MTSVSTPGYVPILKARQGEFEALKNVQLGTRRAMTPLLEVAPKSENETAASIVKSCKDAVAKLKKAAYQYPLMLDAGHFDLNGPVDGTRGVISVLADEARLQGLDTWPVLRLGDPADAVREARLAFEQDGHGLTVRLTGEDIDEEPDDLDNMLQQLLRDTGTQRGDVDLILDVGPLDGDLAVRGTGRLLISLLRDLPRVPDWRTVTIAGGAFPIDLSQFTANVIGERTRFEVQLFDYVRSKRLDRYPDFGDYAVAHPELALGNAFPPPPQLRYTLSDRWLVLKGRRTDPRGNAQFHHICQVIAAHPEFAGTPVGVADQRIAAGSPEGPGNGTTWRMVGTTHHLDYVALRLATLGEP